MATEPAATAEPAAAAGSGSTRAGDMTALFVRRPVLAIVLSLLIAVAGLAAINGVEIRELPDVDSPVISVDTDYSGASPETVDREVTSTIEAAAGRVSGVKSISSSSSFGRSRVTAEFSESTDLNVAASDMRDAIARVSRDLSEEADEPRIVKADSDAQPIIRIAVTSDRLSSEAMTQLVEDGIADSFLAVDGVADVQVYGDRAQVFRIDVDQAQLAVRGLSIGDLATALSDVAFDAPAGSLTRSSQELSVRATANVASTAAFEQLLVDERTRIGDVASVTLGADVGSSSLRANGRTGIGMGIIRQAGSNTIDISRAVHDQVDSILPTLPEGMDIRVTSDDALFVSSSVREVLKSLLFATLIVIAIIYLFLLDLRATLIPAITLPVALIGTVAGIWIAGFSINILTLLALVMATGMVVDDAIVVLENIVEKRNKGMSAKAAAVIGTREVFFAVVTTTAVLAAVFIPLSFLPGKAGGLFREFGFVLAIAVVLSTIVALSLCPMLASRLLTARKPSSGEPVRATGFVRRAGRRLAVLYARILGACLAAPVVVIIVVIGFALFAWQTLGTLDEELIPPEDRAVVLLQVTAPQGVSLDYTTTQLRRIENVVDPIVASGDARNVFSIAGRGGDSSSGFVVVTLAPWDERTRSQQDIVDEINRGLGEIPGVRTMALQPNSLGIRGAGSGLRVALTGNNYEKLAELGDELVAALEDDGRFGRVQLDYETSQPQLSITIDRDRADDLGIPIDGLAVAMQAALDGRELGEVFLDDRAVAVKLVSTTHPVNDPTDLANIFLKAADGNFVPLSTIAEIEEVAIAPSLPREDRSRAVTLSASLSPDLPLRAALNELTRLAEPMLPAGSRLVPLSEAATLNETSSGVGLIFGYAIIIVFLVLAAQFESFVSALIIMVTVPLGLSSAVFALALSGTSLNIYSQIGLVLLVGIMAKNGILIVEFADQLRDRGLSPREAARHAATRRLRPVCMTMFSTILGGVPLILASGAGAEARTAIGWVVVGGLGIATVFTLFLTPVAYQLLAGFSASRGSAGRQLEAELAVATES